MWLSTLTSRNTPRHICIELAGLDGLDTWVLHSISSLMMTGKGYSTEIVLSITCSSTNDIKWGNLEFWVSIRLVVDVPQTVFLRYWENREFEWEKRPSRQGKTSNLKKKTRQKLGGKSFWGDKQPNSYVFLNPIGQLYQWCQISEAIFQVLMIQTYCCSWQPNNIRWMVDRVIFYKS